jgi:hypothetical protein
MKKLFLFTILASLLVPVSGRAQLLENRLRLNSLTLFAGSGLVALKLQTGAFLDMGDGVSDYLYSDGSYIYTPTLFGASTFFATVTTPGFVSMYGANLTKFCPGADTSCFISDGTTIWVTSFGWSSHTLDTCNSANEGAVQRQGGAAGSAVRTKLCLCTSDGAATPTYAWQNIASAAVGNATTCP